MGFCDVCIGWSSSYRHFHRRMRRARDVKQREVKQLLVASAHTRAGEDRARLPQLCSSIISVLGLSCLDPSCLVYNLQPIAPE